MTVLVKFAGCLVVCWRRGVSLSIGDSRFYYKDSGELIVAAGAVTLRRQRESSGKTPVAENGAATRR